MSKEYPEILLYSGGLDSYIAWHFLNKPQTIYYPLRHRYQNFEVRAIWKTIPNTILDYSLELGEWEEKDANIPMRNALMLMMASFYSSRICLVVQKGEMSIPDRSPEFFSKISGWISFLRNGEPIDIFTPFSQMTKTQMVKWYLDNNLSVVDLLKTRSCFSLEPSPCGACGACFRRWVAFKNNGIEESMSSNILEWEGTLQYIEKMKNGQYDALRTEETFRALELSGVKI